MVNGTQRHDEKELSRAILSRHIQRVKDRRARRPEY